MNSSYQYCFARYIIQFLKIQIWKELILPKWEEEAYHVLSFTNLKKLYINTLEYAIFIVFGTFWFGSNILKKWIEVVWKSTTYNWLRENIGVLESRSTCSTDYPFDLLIVIAKATFTGNCLLVNLKSIINVVGCKVILEMNVVSPTWFLVNIHVWITRFFKRVTMSHEPLHNPRFGAMFRNNIIGHPTLRWSFVGDKLGNFK